MLVAMQVLWQQQPLLANNVVTVLDNEKDRRAFSYYPLIDQQQYQLEQGRSFVERIFSGRIAHLVAGPTDGAAFVRLNYFRV
ncbi:BlaI/MecI/CopY family transcriptional regulator [Rheinheimera fenheensis]|uniref:BlaI/MecI/CopY family transcriptional regulator n=1 Tax=Rheinheimera fenheensis TaxID=3152295 RepID=UPI00325C7CB9